MSSALVLVSQHQGLATITLNRPEKRNAMNGQLISDLTNALQQCIADTATRIIMIKAEGKHFCAGADIAWMQHISTQNQETNVADATSLANLMYQLYQCPKPTIVLAHGATMGGGLGLLAACDIAIAADDAQFGLTEVRLGIAPVVISPYVMAAIGERAAHYYFLTGELFNAEQAKTMGLVHRVYQRERLTEEANHLVQTLMSHAEGSLLTVKKLIRQVAKQPITPDLVKSTAQHLATMRALPDAQEGLTAFIEKREPIWRS